MKTKEEFLCVGERRDALFMLCPVVVLNSGTMVGNNEILKIWGRSKPVENWRSL